MFKFITSIKKELILLFSDKLGLMVMFVMPILLVFIITIIQDSAFKIVNEKKISIVVANHDEGIQGQALVNLIDESGFFELSEDNALEADELEEMLMNDDILTALYVPDDFTESLGLKAQSVSSKMMSELGLTASVSEVNIEMPALQLIFDPVLKESFTVSIVRMLSAYTDALENKMMISSVYELMGQELDEEAMIAQLLSNKIKIQSRTASVSGNDILPSSTQHNVPAWTLFAMFFMVVSLGANVVKERVSGSFMRLKIMPSSFSMVLLGKLLVYVAVAILQIAIIFGLSMLLFPLLNLPLLVLPEAILPFIVVVLLSSVAAVSYSLMIGTLSRTMEQCIGIGAVSVIIFGAIGGIWVPTFVMPAYMKVLTLLSPLHWCLEGFYVLFLKGGSWNELLPIIAYIICFILICQVVTLTRLKAEKLL